MNELYQKHFYLNTNIDFLIDTDIREYDMKSAGLTIVKQHKLLSEDKIAVLETMDKKERNIQLGNYLKGNAELIKAHNDGFIEARKLFFEANQLEDTDILSIKKDAIFVIGKNCHAKQFGFYKFSTKNLYHSYLYLNKIEMYYKSKDEPLDVKNLGEDNVPIHREYMLDMLRDFIYLMSMNQSNHQPVISWLLDFIQAYRRKELELGYYREMNENSSFLVNVPGQGTVLFKDVEDLKNVEILYNYYKYMVLLVDILV